MAYDEYLKMNNRCVGTLLYWLHKLSSYGNAERCVFAGDGKTIYTGPSEKVVLCTYTWDEIVPIFDFKGDQSFWNEGLERRRKEHVEYLEKYFGFVNKYVDPAIEEKARAEKFRKSLLEAFGLTEKDLEEGETAIKNFENKTN